MEGQTERELKNKKVLLVVSNRRDKEAVSGLWCVWDIWGYLELEVVFGTKGKA